MIDTKKPTISDVRVSKGYMRYPPTRWQRIKMLIRYWLIGYWQGLLWKWKHRKQN